MKAIADRKWRMLLTALAVLSVLPGLVHHSASKLHAASPMPLPSANLAAAIPALIPSSPAKQAQSAALQEEAQPASPVSDGPQLQQVSSKVYYRNKVAVLTYHHIDPKESSVTITQERFESHLEALRKSGFHVIPVEDFIDFLQKKKPVPPNAVVITFDDGYESVYKYAYPLLKKEGMTATVFLIVGYIEDGTTHFPSILTWSEIDAMHKDGFSFYSHSFHSHESVTVNGKELSELVARETDQATGTPETDAEYRERVGSDLKKADDILSAKLGNRLNLLCLPHGQYNQEVVELAKQDGIPFLFTGNEGLNTIKDMLLKRINAGSPYMTDKLLIRKLTAGG